METVNTRRLRPEDLQSVLTLHLACFPRPLAFSPVLLGTLVTHPGAVAVGAFENHEHVAHALTMAANTPATLYTVAVHPARRGQGLARAVLEATEDILRARGMREWALHVQADNEAAIRLYHSLGFRHAGEDAMAYPGLPDPRGVVMVKQLA